MDTTEELNTARELLTGARRIVALTGAGVSTDSGIPDFRGPNGVWTKDPSAEALSDIDAYVSSPEVRQRTWQARLEHAAWEAQPNEAHRALVRLERSGRLEAIMTQNIDGLHQKAGSDSGTVLELHGTMFETQCLDCGERRDMGATLDRVSAGEVDPPCLACDGMLKSATISFGQALDEDVVARAKAAARSCDLMIAIGSSLTVQPVAGLVGMAAGTGASVVVCNAAETPYDDLAAVTLRGPLTEVLPALM